MSRGSDSGLFFTKLGWNMKSLFLLLSSLFLVACATPEVETVTIVETVVSEIPVTVEVPIEVTRMIEVIQEVETIQEVEVTRIVEVQEVVTATPEPSPTSPPSEDVIALNYVAEAESGGITVEIGRVLVANKDAISQDFSRDSSFDNVEVVGEIVWIVTNNSEETLNIYPDQGSVQINSELVDLFDYFLASFGDDVSGEIPPGVTLIGGQWFGINRNEVSDVTEMIIRFGGPSNDSFSRVGEDFEIVVDLSERIFEPLPEEFAP